ncbi:DNA/RNA non-specific endonuclease [Conyzicola nivalis]|uniref:DNA/RNA non-specific endonuclease n=1 Tax=Conyzicola nivalis TaxID=1477021 RepID=UPI003570C495
MSDETADATTGYDPTFLSVQAGPTEIPLPGTAQPTIRLDYTHFTVLLDPERRLAAATAVNIDGARLIDVERGDDWHLDPRVDEDEQAGAELYARNDLDRGHLVRRRDPVWGADAERANRDTFVYTNAAPQAAQFNQSKELWSGLEDYVLANAETFDRRLSVFTGPIFAPDDPPYRGVLIPRLFYKVAAWAGATGVEAAGYILDQRPQLDDIDLATATALAVGDPPPLGPFRTFQVPVADIAQLAGLSIDVLIDADVHAAQTSWLLMTQRSEILLER